MSEAHGGWRRARREIFSNMLVNIACSKRFLLAPMLFAFAARRNDIAFYFSFSFSIFFKITFLSDAALVIFEASVKCAIAFCLSIPVYSSPSKL